MLGDSSWEILGPWGTCTSRGASTVVSCGRYDFWCVQLTKLQGMQAASMIRGDCYFSLDAQVTARGSMQQPAT